MERSGTEPPASASGLTRRQRKRQRRAIRAQQWAVAEDSRQDLAEATAEQRILRAREHLDGMQNRVAPFLGATTEQTEQLRTYAAAIGAFEL